MHRCYKKYTMLSKKSIILTNSLYLGIGCEETVQIEITAKVFT